MLTFFVGLAVGLPIGGLLMWAFNSYLKADVQKIATYVRLPGKAKASEK